jgi:toxin ParE1/3/4
MKLVWTRRAIRHLTGVRDYIAEDSPRAAQQLVTRLLEAVDRLAEQPHMGRAGRIPGTRELVVPSTPYVIAYRFRRDRLELIGVVHGRQKWPEKF